MENLIKLRKERNLTTRQIAELLKVSKSTYNNWEIGVSQPDINNLIKLSDYFCVSIDYIVGNSKINEKHTPVAKKISSEELRPEEIEMIKKIRLLGPYEQIYIRAQIDALSDTAKSKQKEKI